jgi:hypothetical protein
MQHHMTTFLIPNSQEQQYTLLEMETIVWTEFSDSLITGGCYLCSVSAGFKYFNVNRNIFHAIGN